MITHITGEVFHQGLNYVVLKAGGVGYKVYTLPEIAAGVRKNKTFSLWTHHVTRDDTTELYGFPLKYDLDFFEMLISISGIGPRSALQILALAPTETLSRAIAAGDTTYLTKVSGIGRKTAGKIVLELKEKIVVETNRETASMRAEESETLEALQALGYSTAQARDALKKVSADTEGTGSKIKEALKALAQ